MTEFHFLQPLDVLYLRGNRLFGDSSATGEAIMPPWPSLAAGALRSQMLASHGIDVGQFACNKTVLSGALAQSLGTPEQPGDFRISHFLLANYEASVEATPSSRQLNVYWPLPADVVVTAMRMAQNKRIRYDRIDCPLRFKPARLASKSPYSAPINKSNPKADCGSTPQACKPG